MVSRETPNIAQSVTGVTRRARLSSARGIFSSNFEDTLGRTLQRCSEKIIGRTI